VIPCATGQELSGSAGLETLVARARPFAPRGVAVEAEAQAALANSTFAKLLVRRVAAQNAGANASAVVVEAAGDGGGACGGSSSTASGSASAATLPIAAKDASASASASATAAATAAAAAVAITATAITASATATAAARGKFLEVDVCGRPAGSSGSSHSGLSDHSEDIGQCSLSSTPRICSKAGGRDVDSDDDADDNGDDNGDDDDAAGGVVGNGSVDSRLSVLRRTTSLAATAATATESAGTVSATAVSSSFAGSSDSGSGSGSGSSDKRISPAERCIIITSADILAQPELSPATAAAASSTLPPTVPPAVDAPPVGVVGATEEQEQDQDHLDTQNGNTSLETSCTGGEAAAAAVAAAAAATTTTAATSSSASSSSTSSLSSIDSTGSANSPTGSANSPTPSAPRISLAGRDLWGWYQHDTSAYTAADRRMAGELFEVRADVREALAPGLARLRELGSTIVAVHVRRGDYASIASTTFGFAAPTAWYVAALRELWRELPSPVLFVATDDRTGEVLQDFAEFSPQCAASLGVSMPPSAKGLGAGFFPDFWFLANADVAIVSNSTFGHAACLVNATRRAGGSDNNHDDADDVGSTCGSSGTGDGLASADKYTSNTGSINSSSSSSSSINSSSSSSSSSSTRPGRYMRVTHSGEVVDFDPWRSQPVWHRDQADGIIGRAVNTLDIVRRTGGWRAVAHYVAVDLPMEVFREAALKAALTTN
jgi:hypothetical protein